MSAPVGHTCPDIDKIIQTITDVCKELRYANNSEDRNVITNTIDDSATALEEYVGKRFNPLEDLRESNAKLRDWGEGLEADVNQLEQKIDVLDEEIESLKYQLKNAEEQNTELVNQIIDLENQIHESN